MRGVAAMTSLLGIAALGGCAASVTTQQGFLSGTGPTSDFAVPVRSMEDQRFHTVVRQRYDFSCGSAALATLLHFHYARPVDEKVVFAGMWNEGDRAAIRKVGFSLLDMKRYLSAEGYRADGFKVSLDQVAKTGIPGIALITVRNYRHFVVVKGVRRDEVLLGDPSTGLRGMPRADFEKAWNGVYFVLNSQQHIGRRAFNGDAQWAAYTRAPVGGRFVDPLSLQALALTAPFRGDF